jgi:TolB-like protein
VSVEPAPGTVAVFPFDYVGSDPGLAPLGRALAEMLTTDLSQTERLVVLERARAQVLVDEMALAGAGVVDPATAARGGRILGAHRVVQGQLDAAGEEVTVEARLVGGAPDAHTSEGALRASDRLARFFDLEKLLALDIYRTLGVELTAAERERVTRNRTESVEALIAFGLGLEAQDQGRWEDARTHFDQAVRTDPSFEAAAAQLATSETLANAASQGLDALADLGADLVAVIGPTSPDLLADQLLAIEQLVPGLLGRDPLAEFLGNEGLTPTVAVLELILRRPGGDE